MKTSRGHRGVCEARVPVPVESVVVFRRSGGGGDFVRGPMQCFLWCWPLRSRTWADWYRGRNFAMRSTRRFTKNCSSRSAGGSGNPGADHEFASARIRANDLKAAAVAMPGNEIDRARRQRADRLPSSEDLSTPALDRLLWIFLRLLVSQQGLDRFLRIDQRQRDSGAN